MQAGTFTLASSGDIVGGTISTSGSGVFLCTGGTLTGTSFQSALSLGATSTSLYLQGADTFTGTGGTGAGSITLGASGDTLYTIDNFTLDNATLTFGATNAADYVRVYSLASNTDTLTFGSNLSVVQSANGNQTTIDLYSDVNTSGTFINKGTITASAKNGLFRVYDPSGNGNFVNQGAINVSNSDTVSLATNVTSSALGSFTTTTGGVLRLENGYTLSNTGATLALSSGSQLTLAGIVAGGTISDTGSGLLSQSGTLSGVTYLGTLTLGASTSINVQNGLTGSTTGSATIINDTGNGSSLYAYDVETLDYATLDLGNSTGTSYLYAYASNNASATLTLGSHFTLAQTGASATVYIDQQNSGNTLINKGTITAGVHNGLLRIYGPYSNDTFINQGLLSASNADTISLQTNLSSSGLGSFATATGGVILLSGGYTLSNTGATLSLGSAAQLTLAGTIQGGTVADSGGGLVSQGGTLNGVTYQGTLSLATNTILNIYNGLNVTNGGAAGVINDTGNGAYLDFYDTQTLDNATVNIGNGTGYATLYLDEDTGSAATLTLGSHLTLAQTGTYARIYIDEQNAGNALINKGTITAGAHNGTLNIYGPYAGDTFTNQGSLIASNGDSIVLQTNVTTAGLGAFSTASGGAIVLSNSYTLSNAGATLALSTGSQFTLGGEILGGTVSDPGGGLVSQGGTLSGVTYQGTLNVGASTSLNIYNGLNVVSGGAAGVINDTGNGSSLYFYDTQTLDNATLNIGNGTSYSYLYLYEDTGPAATLTLGSHLTLAQTGADARIYIDQQNAGNSLINQGTITAGVHGGTLNIYGYYTGDTFTNQGSLIASNGDSIVLQTNVTTTGLGAFSTSGGGAVVLSSNYTLSNVGATLALSTGSQLTLAGEILGGTVSDSGGGLVSQSGTLSGVTYQGTLNVGASTSLNIYNGLNVVSGGAVGAINDAGNAAYLYFYDTQTLDNATLNIGSGTGYSYLFVEEDTGSAATLTLGSHLTLAQTGANAQIVIDQQNAGNALINKGTITAGAHNGVLYIYGPYAGDTFTTN